MNINRIQNVLVSLMTISFLIFLGLFGILIFSSADVTPRAVSLPFAFLYLTVVTLVITGRIQEQPSAIRNHIQTWLVVSIFGIILAAFAFTFT